jgi:alpha-methylacyl-CoA racemase
MNPIQNHGITHLWFKLRMDQKAKSLQTSLLTGTRVLDCSQFIPGPYATLVLADLGAEVVKVEPPGGDPARYFGAMDKDGLSALYKLINRNKTVVELDLKSATGQTRFKKMLQLADIFFESYRPDVFARLGFAREDLRSLNPRLIHVALTGYGQSGAYRLRAGHDLNYVSLAGVLAQSGLSELPIQSMPPTADFAGGLNSALMILAAIIYRQRTGVGLSIDVSMSESVLAWQSLHLTESARTAGGIKRGSGLLSGGAAFYQIYRTSDQGFVTLAAIEPKFWTNFCKAVGKPEWVTRQSEQLPQVRLIKDVAELFAGMTLAEWCEKLEPVDCCFERVHELSDLMSNVQIKDRQMIDRFNDQGAVVEVLFPAWIEGMPPAKRSPHRLVAAEEVMARWQAENAD